MDIKQEIRGMEVFYGINCLMVAGLFIYGMIAHAFDIIDSFMWGFIFLIAYSQVFSLFVFSTVIKIIKRIEKNEKEKEE